ncbi:MAG: ABC transporter ATP-binding protein [Caldilinea sp.]|nr:ABC transporter ATP-binding protein [Caldilinea sp.]MDW8440508.1 ABC transporter ATP-binding protein [Caldilineaceae bacterium]
MESILQTVDLTIGYGKPNRNHHLNKRRPTHSVASGLNLHLRAGEMVCLLGPNGAGKSTLMRTLAGLQPPLEGTVEIAGRDIRALTPSQLARLLAIVLTERIDVGNLCAYDLIALGRHPYTDWTGRFRIGDHAVVERALRAVQAWPLRWRPVNELSDGERQKVMIARALAQEPAILLLDEPTAFLDLPRRVEIMAMLHELTRATGCAILLSTHDLDLALRSADRLWLLEAGGVIHTGAPEELVLNGAFAAVFRGEGVEFDAEQGVFRLRRPHRGVAIVLGEGLHAFWTVRALQRLGFETQNRDAQERNGALEVRIVNLDGVSMWVTSNGRREQVHSSLTDLIESLVQVSSKEAP